MTMQCPGMSAQSYRMPRLCFLLTHFEWDPHWELKIDSMDWVRR